MTHPSFGRIVDLVEDRLAAPERTELQAHLETGCDPCREAMQWFTRVREAMLTDTTPDPPEWLVRRAVTLFRRMPSLPQPPRAGRLVAALVYDSSTSGRAGQVRRHAPAESRSLLFRAEHIDVDLQVWRGVPEGVLVAHGQVLARGDSMPPARARVDLLDLDEVVDSTVTDEFGEFELEDVPSTPFDLRIQPQKGKEILLLGVEATPRSTGERG
ncbi:MAG: hypothetical protein AB1486_11075 [Planctomycetota bacterium]